MFVVFGSVVLGALVHSPCAYQGRRASANMPDVIFEASREGMSSVVSVVAPMTRPLGFTLTLV